MTSHLLALDPSFTATGWVVVDLGHERVVAAGVIRTAKAKASERLLSAADDTRRGLEIAHAVRAAINAHSITVAAAEASCGSKSATAAKALARAQQAVACAVVWELGSPPIYVTPQTVKKLATGTMSASKDAVEAAMREHWPCDWDALLKGVAPGKRENAFDAAAVAHAVWNKPAVAMLRQLARGRRIRSERDFNDRLAPR